jgi:hypothetical protein
VPSLTWGALVWQSVTWQYVVVVVVVRRCWCGAATVMVAVDEFVDDGGGKATFVVC